MPMRYSDELIEEIRSKNDIVDVIGEVVLGHDEYMRPQTDMQSLASLQPSFQAMGERAGGAR